MENVKKIENDIEVPPTAEAKICTLDIDCMSKEDLVKLILTIDVDALSKSDQDKIEKRIGDTGLLI